MQPPGLTVRCGAQELLELRWLSVQVDKLQDAEIAAKKAEGRVVTAESWADERVATAQREAAARVAEASGNFEDKLEAFKKKQQAQTAAQVAEANAKVKLGISKAREVVLKQKAQWAQRMQVEWRELPPPACPWQPLANGRRANGHTCAQRTATSTIGCRCRMWRPRPRSGSAR
jgi:hypothetical protein